MHCPILWSGAATDYKCSLLVCWCKVLMAWTAETASELVRRTPATRLSNSRKSSTLTGTWRAGDALRWRTSSASANDRSRSGSRTDAWSGRRTTAWRTWPKISWRQMLQPPLWRQWHTTREVSASFHRWHISIITLEWQSVGTAFQNKLTPVVVLQITIAKLPYNTNNFYSDNRHHL